jgi:hypothetical protein
MRSLVSCDDLVRSHLHFAAWRHTRAQSVTRGEASQTRNASLSRNPPLKVVVPLLHPSARAVPCEWHMELGRSESQSPWPHNADDTFSVPPNGPPPRRHVNASLTILSVNARWIPRACVYLAHARPAGGTASNRAPFFRAPVSADNTIHFCTQRQRARRLRLHGRSPEEVKTTPSLLLSLPSRYRQGNRGRTSSVGCAIVKSSVTVLLSTRIGPTTSLAPP